MVQAVLGASRHEVRARDPIDLHDLLEKASLVDWLGFQRLFLHRWHERFVDRLYEIARPLVDYTQPMLSTLEEKAGRIKSFDYTTLTDRQHRFTSLAPLGSMPRLRLHGLGGREPKLPFDVSQVLVGRIEQITSYRAFEKFYGEIVAPVVAMFDEMFGECVRFDDVGLTLRHSAIANP